MLVTFRRIFLTLSIFVENDAGFDSLRQRIRISSTKCIAFNSWKHLSTILLSKDSAERRCSKLMQIRSTVLAFTLRRYGRLLWPHLERSLKRSITDIYLSQKLTRMFTGSLSKVSELPFELGLFSLLGLNCWNCDWIALKFKYNSDSVINSTTYFSNFLLLNWI